ncbi:MAG: hypothetical protein HZB65_03130 [Candidatus Aenigmarchaeota archaeon]|nr:hypothetical protein [Candidatus Aenigmarchaeota archaeon]
MGITIGLHALAGEHDSLESGDRRNWMISHRNLVSMIKNAKEVGIEFIVIHLSSTPQFIMRERELRPFGHTYQVVGPDGKPFWSFAERSEYAKEETMAQLASPHYCVDHDIMKKRLKKLNEEYTEKYNKKRENGANEITAEISRWKKSKEYADLREAIRREVEQAGASGERLEKYVNEALRRQENEKLGELNNKLAQELKEIKDEHETKSDRIQRGVDKEELYELWKQSKIGQYFLELGEISAYHIVGYHMWKTRDPIWMSIVGDMGPDQAYGEKHPEFNAAVACYYIKEHLTLKDNEHNKDYKSGLAGSSVLDFVNKSNIILSFETPHSGSPGSELEGRFRLFQPDYAEIMLDQIGSSNVGFTADFEHMLSQGLHIDKDVIEKVSGNFGKHVKVIHLGTPVPYGGTAHVPIALGSMAQEAIYKWLFEFRKRGFKNGYVIYERGGGDSPQKVVEQSIHAIRFIVEYLEKNIKPDDLPEAFYGVSEQNAARFAIQMNAIREHAWDPLKGMITIPEEEHTFLSKAAIEKGKAEEWKKAKFR